MPAVCKDVHHYGKMYIKTQALTVAKHTDCSIAYTCRIVSKALEYAVLLIGNKKRLIYQWFPIFVPKPCWSRIAICRTRDLHCFVLVDVQSLEPSPNRHNWRHFNGGNAIDITQYHTSKMYICHLIIACHSPRTSIFTDLNCEVVCSRAQVYGPLSFVEITSKVNECPRPIIFPFLCHTTEMLILGEV